MAVSLRPVHRSRWRIHEPHYRCGVQSRTHGCFDLSGFSIAGTLAYQTIPKEAEPDIPIPIIYVSSTLDGISPEDAERLLVKPIEKVLQTIEGVKEIRSTASEGRASVVLEFNAGFDNEQALADVEEEVDAIENDLPPDATTKVVEINLALFPVVTLLLSGDVPDRALNQLAKRLQDEIESLPPVLEVELSGYRDEVVEAVVDASTIEAYGLSLLEVGNLIRSNNLLVAPGALDSGWDAWCSRSRVSLNRSKTCTTCRSKWMGTAY